MILSELDFSTLNVREASLSCHNWGQIEGPIENTRYNILTTVGAYDAERHESHV